MKRIAALALGLALFTAPAVALASDWDGPSLQEIFGETYVQSIVYGDSIYLFGK